MKEEAQKTLGNKEIYLFSTEGDEGVPSREIRIVLPAGTSKADAKAAAISKFRAYIADPDKKDPEYNKPTEPRK